MNSSRGLWNRGRRLFALVAWALWPAVLVMTLLAAVGFAAGNLGDAIAGRARTAGTAVDLRNDLRRLRTERAGITEPRSVAEIRPPLDKDGMWLVRPDGYVACSARDAEEIGKYLDGLMGG